MAKHRKKQKRESHYNFTLSRETQRGLVAVFLFALSTVLLLANLRIAGNAGEFFDSIGASIFGYARYFLVPAIAGAGLLHLLPTERHVRAGSLVGLFLFLAATVGVLHVGAPLIGDSINPGGSFGSLLGDLAMRGFGRWASLVLFLAFDLAAILLIFNTSLEQIVSGGRVFGTIATFLIAPFRALHARLDKNDGPRILSDGEPIDVDDENEDHSFITREIPLFKGEQQKMPAPVSMEKPVVPPSEFAAGMKRRARKKIDLSLDLLDERSTKPTPGDIKKNMDIIQKTLANFGIMVEMGDISIGPTVTQYTFRPQEGVKLTKITGLANDLSLALAAHPIRLEAPIPGKSLVGIEVPNQTVAVVGLRELLDSSAFRDRKSNLSVALGKDVAGHPWFADLPRMPHLLVAGATGSGKTVCLNTMIISLLYQNSPDELKLILIDPKRVELPVYNGIPHLLVPTITDVPKTVNALRWTIGEMERRFGVLEEAHVRDIGSYNLKAEEKMPTLVVVVDELADLMIAASREIEAAIIRIAQMARAVGIHLILATQRPSVDVITGLIKANVPARIAFSVASQTDSRTILDSAGAEKLLGRGDMLFTAPELSKPRRIQGAFVSEEEIKRIVESLKADHEAPEYDHSVVEKPKNGSIGTSDTSGGDDDPLIPEAKEVIIQAGKASASLLQRRLKVGYARAARLLDLLEAEGFIGPGDGAKPREILTSSGPTATVFTPSVPLPTDNPEPDTPEEEYENDVPPWE